jgi:predicted exporter
MTGSARAATTVWALFTVLCGALVARATYTADLSAFLPRAPSAAQRLLVEQLRAGPAVHLLLLGITGGDATTRAGVSAAVAAQLRSDPAFSAVSNGDAAQLARDREVIFAHRYQLSPQMQPARFTAAGLHAALSDSLDALASPEGLLLKPLFVRDPTGETLAILDTFSSAQPPHSTAGVWSSADGSRALLLVQLRAAGSDTDAQQRACATIRRAFAAALAQLPPGTVAPRLLMTGPPLQGVEARATIRREVLRLSILSTLLIALLLLIVYRSAAALLLTLVPMMTGALAGIAAVALGFGYVHGITLAFGVTLIGEAVDYSIYLFIQRSNDFAHSVWPTVRLGMFTSICGFAALLPSGFTGLAQLGLYSIAGLIVAAAVTRFVLPGWAMGMHPLRDLNGLGLRLLRIVSVLRPARALLVLVPLAALAVLYLHRGALWSRELSALSPTPQSYARLDDQLRADAGATESGYLAIVSGADREAALTSAQALEARLSPLVDAGVIGGFDSPARYLPARALQQARQRSLPPAAELRARLDAALAGLPLRASVLEPFLHDAEQARTAAPLSEADLSGTSLAAATGALLVGGAQGWSALLPVTAIATGGELSPAAAARLQAAVSADPALHASLLDLKGEADRLYSGYLADAVRLAVIGFGAIVVLLLCVLRSPLRVARVVAPLALAVLTVGALLVGAGERLSILHVVGMLLIVAVGSNYALFFDRRGAQPQQGSAALTLASLLTANLATVLAFGVLAFSRVPVLADLGSTVAPGAFLALLFSALLAPDPHAAAGHGAR